MNILPYFWSVYCWKSLIQSDFNFSEEVEINKFETKEGVVGEVREQALAFLSENNEENE